MVRGIMLVGVILGFLLKPKISVRVGALRDVLGDLGVRHFYSCGLSSWYLAHSCNFRILQIRHIIIMHS
jgi:hypothetical protein